METCVFCRIINKELENMIFFENEFVIGMLDINPVVPGHSLIIPKTHSENTMDIDERTLFELIKGVKHVGKILKEKLNIDGYNILSANGKCAQQTVFHTHYHIIPRYNNDNLDLGFHGDKAKLENQKQIFKLLSI
jgi:histidine triad (HIT) family protein